MNANWVAIARVLATVATTITNATILTMVDRYVRATLTSAVLSSYTLQTLKRCD